MKYLITIDDFVEDLNYTNIILHIGKGVKKEDLRKVLETDEVDDMCYFDEAWDDGFFYIERGGLRTLDTRLDYIITEWGGSWCVLELNQFEFDSAFYVEVPQLFDKIFREE